MTLLLPSANLPLLYAQDSSLVKRQEPIFLTFDELISLSKNPTPEEPLKTKLKTFWETPLIDNHAYYQGISPHRPNLPKLGPSLRLISWNIEKSLKLPQALQLFSQKVTTKNLFKHAQLISEPNIPNQRNKLFQADVLVLQEMDIGNKRSGYLNAAEEIAKVLGMNYAFGPMQLEVDPVPLGLENLFFKDGEIDQEATHFYQADPDRYKGVFGSAVLSRYPIKFAEVFQLNHHAYDWYQKEKDKTTFLEKARRTGSKVAFKNQITREMKVGGRNFFRVDLEVPDLPNQTLTIINVHLEIKCEPKEREKQIQEILSYIKGISNPVILVGDFNAAPSDLSPTNIPRTIKRTAQNPSTWLGVVINYLTPDALFINTSRTISNKTKNLDNPLAADIPVIAPNPVRDLFKTIENFRFDDGGAFDFRGDKKRSIFKKKGPLSNSNQHDLKGFKTTFSVNRPLWVIGKYRLDWIFVKSFLKDPNNPIGSYKFAPHFGETLSEMNNALKEKISDHHPNIVDLPFNEPEIDY